MYRRPILSGLVTAVTGLALASFGQEIPLENGPESAPGPGAGADTSLLPPANHVTNVAPARGEGAIDFALIAPTQFAYDTLTATFPDDLKNMEGKTIRIRGFMFPYNDPENMQLFILVEKPMGCYFCSPPPPEHVIGVRQAAGGNFPCVSEPIEVEGVLKLWRNESDERLFKDVLYVIDQARVRRC